MCYKVKRCLHSTDPEKNFSDCPKAHPENPVGPLPSIQHSDVWENAQGMGNSSGTQNQRAYVKKCQLSVNLS